MNFQFNNRTSSTLLNNAFDFLESASSILATFSGRFKYITESELKTALITSTTAVELVIKSKVSSLDWRELFANPLDADILKLTTGEFKSVGFEKSLERLEQLMNQSLSPNIKAKIEVIRKTRNKLIHYHFTANSEAFAILISNAIDAFIEFYRTHIRDSIYEEQDRTKEYEKKLFDVEKYIDIRLETVRARLESYQRPKTLYFSECNNCLQDVFILKDEVTVHCLFCENEENIEEEAAWRSAIRNCTQVCPNCKLESVIALSKHPPNEEQAWECIKCGYYINRAQRWMGGDSSIRNDV